LIGSVIVAAWKAPLTLASIPIFAYGFVKIRARYMASSRELKRLEAVSKSPVLASLSEAMEGASTIRAHRLEAAFERQFAKLAEQNSTLYWHSFMLLPWMISRVDFLGSVCILATALSLTLLGGGSTVSGAVAFSFIINFTGKLQWAVRQSIEAENYLTSVERCEHFERIAQEKEPSGASAAEAEAQLVTAITGTSEPALEFRNVSVRYRPNLPLVIRDLSIVVQPGERIGIIGRTGCGKSTLTLCIF